MKSRNHSFTVAADPQVTATVHYKSNLSAVSRGDLVPVAAVIPEQILIKYIKGKFTMKAILY